MSKGRWGVAVVAAAGIAVVSASAASAAKPVSGTIGGPVTAVQGQTFTVKSSLTSTGKANILVKAATVISEEQTVGRTGLKKGVCVVAVGQKDKQGVVQAQRVMLSAPVKGKCQGGFGGGQGGGTPPQGAPPANGQQPPQGGGPPGGAANFGFASGAITGISGSTVTVHGSQGTTKVFVSAKTQVVRNARVGMSAVKVGLCAFVQGTSTDKGLDVDAQTVNLSKPGPQGCTGGPRRG